MWILYAFLSSIFAGITAIFAKIGIKHTSSNVATAIRTVIILIFSWGIVFAFGGIEEINNVSLKDLFFLVLSGLATGLSWIFYFKALEAGEVNKVVPIDKSSIILTMIFALVFLGESFDFIKLFALVFIGFGTFLMIENKEETDIRVKEKRPGKIAVNEENFDISNDVSNKITEAKTEEKITHSKWFIYALSSAVFASLTSILAKVGISDINSNLGTAIRTVIVLIMAFVFITYTGEIKGLKNVPKKDNVYICLSGVTTGFSWLFYYAALKLGEASVVVPIDKLSIVVTVIFSCLVLKEKLSLKAFIGLMMIVIGTLSLVI